MRGSNVQRFILSNGHKEANTMVKRCIFNLYKCSTSNICLINTVVMLIAFKGPVIPPPALFTRRTCRFSMQSRQCTSSRQPTDLRSAVANWFLRLHHLGGQQLLHALPPDCSKEIMSRRASTQLHSPHLTYKAVTYLCDPSKEYRMLPLHSSSYEKEKLSLMGRGRV